MNIDRNRRYARLMALTHKPDDSTATWAWWASDRWDTYCYGLRYLQSENLKTSRGVVNLQLENKELA